MVIAMLNYQRVHLTVQFLSCFVLELQEVNPHFPTCTRLASRGAPSYSYGKWPIYRWFTS